MATMMPLQQALKSLCSRTGWCYAVFWKLKRRSRMMLTWEDGYYDYSKTSVDACNGANARTDTGGNPLDQGGSGDLEGQIGLAVARMSYYVYSMGEGIIGRVAFTGKHQWVFHDGENCLGTISRSSLSSPSVPEKNPDGWKNQFVAGIKTIAVIAVPQGVVQLGSTKLMIEDLKWIDHVKSVFSALQTAPSAPRSEMILEVQGGRSPYTNKLPFHSVSNTSIVTKKTVTAQHSQPVPRNTEDAVQWQKFGAQANPAVVAKLQGLQSSSISTAGAVCQEPQFQQAVKVLVEPQSTKYSSAVSGPQTTQLQHNVSKFEVSSNLSDHTFPCYKMKRNCLEDLREGNVNKGSTWTSVVGEGLSSDMHIDSKRHHVVSTCGGGFVDKRFASPHKDYTFKKMHAMCSMPDNRKEEDLSGSSFRPGQQQKLNCPKTVEKNPNCADIFPVTGRVVSTEYLHNKVYSAAANLASHVPDKSFHANDGFVPLSMDNALVNTSGRDVLNKTEPECSERQSNLCSYGGPSDANTLDELEKFLASFAKEETGNWESSFAIGDELSQALGPAFWKGVMDEVPNLGGDQKSEELVLDQAGKASMPLVEAVANFGSNIRNENSYERLAVVCPLERKPEALLEAVVGKASISLSSNTDASFSTKTPTSNSACGLPALSITQEVEPTCSSSLSGKHLQTSALQEAKCHDNSARELRSAQSHQNFNVSSDTCTNVSLYSWTDEGQSFKSDDTQRAYSQAKRSEELSKASKKRSRSGETARPRPKDRQQIQDRVRELRDIVPNGSKCSIDALLEKTIKHMLFLHSVTLHADQLKNTGELKEDPDSGATWALDLGSQEKRCPIVVKDLNQPRQMLVEMMCEDSGIFLETADIIRNLGLTILRGSLESHEDKFWARFIVEANRDIERVNVLASLIQRLHLDNNSSSSSMTMASNSTAVKPQHGVESSNSFTISGKR